MSTGSDADWPRLSDGERVVWRGGPHRWSAAKAAIVGAATVVGFGAIEPAAGLMWLPAVLALVVGAHVWYGKIEYAITTRRIYRREGVLDKTEDRLPVADVLQVDREESLLGNRIGYATVAAHTVGRTITLGRVPDPETVEAQIEQLADEETGTETAGNASGEGALDGVDPGAVERVRDEAKQLRVVAVSLEDAVAGGED